MRMVVELWLLLTNCWQMVLVFILPEPASATLSYELPPSNFPQNQIQICQKKNYFYNFYTHFWKSNSNGF